MAGRHSKLTAERAKKIVELVRAGSFRETAAKHAGIHVATFMRWMAQGEREEAGPHRELCEAVKAAEAEAEVRAVVNIQKAAQAPKHWTANAWFLERKFPERWALTQKVQLQVDREITAGLARLKAALPPEWYEVALVALTTGTPGSEGVEGPPGDKGE